MSMTGIKLSLSVGEILRLYIRHAKFTPANGVNSDVTIVICFFVLSVHRHLPMNDINTFEVYRSKKELIKNDAEKIENKVLPACKEMEKDIEAHISNIDEAFERVILAVENHGTRKSISF